MSIIITNISEHYGGSHIQTYSLKINNKEICQFKHYQKDGLADCLYQAYLAVGGKQEVKYKDDTICDSDFGRITGTQRR
jgi:hypothetical protein